MSEVNANCGCPTGPVSPIGPGNLFGGQTSLLFFFLLLVIIFCNCGIFKGNTESLLFFFLLLVVLFTGKGLLGRF